ncbi:hypothetical protein WICPIJ_004295 [Wickerhamomyces pijperi]|uniref:LAA1-like C-terminal TPR repeats domain-containing protein n=1 Tax=Wickerhamomyces pijperi TaxID=599730 RepID=A0A9P8TN11_WICPI|nr:hypothetical protein WICPIJ_004295 [Wickerhamomyces pijperi]
MEQILSQLNLPPLQSANGSAANGNTHNSLILQQRLLTLIIDSHIHISTKTKGDEASESAAVKKDLIETIQHLDHIVDEISKQQTSAIINTSMSEQIAQLYVTLLTQEPLKLYQCTNKFITSFTNDAADTSKSKSLGLSLLPVYILSAIYQFFGKDVTSFIPLLITTSLKQIKENASTDSTPSTLSLAYSTLLATVVKVIYRLNLVNEQHSSMMPTESQVSKYLKLLNSKTLQSENTILGELYSIFGQVTMLSQSTTTTATSSNPSNSDPIDLARFKKAYFTTYIIPAFNSSFPEVRSSIAKSMSRVLGASNVLDFHQVVKFYYEVYHECVIKDFTSQGLYIVNDCEINKDESYGIEIFESLTDLIVNKGVVSSASATASSISVGLGSADLNEHIMDYFRELLTTFLAHQHHNHSLLIKQLLMVVKAMVESISEMFKVSFFDKLYQSLQKNNDKESLNESQTLLVLQSMKMILTQQGHTNSLNLDVDKYQIVLIQLSLSSSSSSSTEIIRDSAIDTLVLLVRHSPIIMKEMLRNFFNEIKQMSNNSSSSSSKTNDKNLGMSLIVSNLLRVVGAELDDPTDKLGDQIWKFGFNYIKANQESNGDEDPFLIGSWTLIAGVLSSGHSDKQYLASLIEDFKLLWATAISNIAPSGKAGSSNLLLEYQMSAMDALITHHIDELAAQDLNYFMESISAQRAKTTTKGKVQQVIEQRLFKLFHKFNEKSTKGPHSSSTSSSILIGAVYNLTEYPNQLCSKWTEFQSEQRCLHWLNEWSLGIEGTVSDSTSVIDSSIGIFIDNFAIVSEKIQLSLIEIMRNFIVTTTSHAKKEGSSDLKKTVAVLGTNVSFAINGALKMTAVSQSSKNTRRRTFAVNGQVKANLLDTLQLLYETTPSEGLLLLNAESIGLLHSVTNSVNEQSNSSISLIISKIVNNDEWRMRCFNALILSNIYKYGHSNFQEIFSVLLTLMKDPNVQVHHYAMVALTGLLESHVTVLQLDHVKELLLSLHSSSCSSSASLKVLSFVKALVINLGFGLQSLEPSIKAILKNVLMGSLYSPTLSQSQAILLQIFNELIIFDSSMIPLELILKYLKAAILNNLTNYRIGDGKFQLNLSLQSELQSLDCSNLPLLRSCLKLVLNISKINEGFQFPAYLENLLWCVLEKYPDLPEMEDIIRESVSLSSDFPQLMKKYILSFNKSRLQVLQGYWELEKSVVNKYRNVNRNKKDATAADEESQSINKQNSNLINASDPINWRFKQHLLTSITAILEQSSVSDLTVISTEIEPLIKISFNASTSHISLIKAQGIKLLRMIIYRFASFKDPIFPQFTLLHQQQAQIISAIVPAFDKASDANIATDALGVIGLLIGRNVISRLKKTDRLVILLTDSLNGVCERNVSGGNSETVICGVPLTSEMSFRVFQVGVLNAWAELGLMSLTQSDNDTSNSDGEPIQKKLLEDHMSDLLPQWISVLKQYTVSTCRGSDGSKSELIKLVKIVRIISLIVETDASQIETLLKDDASSFYYVMYADCLYLLTTTHNQPDSIISVLQSTTGLLQASELVRLIYGDEKIFMESYEVWKRLLCVNGASSEIQLAVVDVIVKLFNGIVGLVGDEISEMFIEKLFELIELVFLPLNSTDAGSDWSVVPTILNRALDDMIYKLPPFLMSDLMLVTFKFTLRYVQRHSFALSIIKKILLKFKDVEAWDTINQIYQRTDFSFASNGINSLLLFTVFLNTAQDHFHIHNSSQIVALIKHQLFNDKENIQLTIQSVKSIILISSSSSKSSASQIIKPLSLYFLTTIHANITDLPLSEQSKIFIELFILILKTSTTNTLPLYQSLVPILLQIGSTSDIGDHGDGDDEEYIRSKLNYIISLDQDFFKRNVIMNDTLSDRQKRQLRTLLQS